MKQWLLRILAIAVFIGVVVTMHIASKRVNQPDSLPNKQTSRAAALSSEGLSPNKPYGSGKNGEVRTRWGNL